MLPINDLAIASAINDVSTYKQLADACKIEASLGITPVLTRDTVLLNLVAAAEQFAENETDGLALTRKIIQSENVYFLEEEDLSEAALESYIANQRCFIF